MNRKGGVIIGLVAWLALIVGAGALILSWNAYNQAPSQNLTQDLGKTYDEYYQKTRLQIGQLEINNNLESAKRDIQEGDYNSALTQVEEAEDDLEQLAADLNTTIPQNTVFSQLKEQIRSQDREGSLETIRQLQDTIKRISENARQMERR